MSLVELESFVAVAEEGNVSRAAKRLHVSQPPLSRRIQSLETSLGVPLFIRRHRGMDLSPAGARLLAHAREILTRVEEAKRSLVDAPSSEAARGRAWTGDAETPAAGPAGQLAAVEPASMVLRPLRRS